MTSTKPTETFTKTIRTESGAVYRFTRTDGVWLVVSFRCEDSEVVYEGTDERYVRELMSDLQC